MILIAVTFLFISYIVTIYLDELKRYIASVTPDSSCPKDFAFNRDPESLSYKQEVLDDWLKPVEEQKGLMGCYCFKHTSWSRPWTFLFQRKFYLTVEGQESDPSSKTSQAE